MQSMRRQSHTTAGTCNSRFVRGIGAIGYRQGAPREMISALPYWISFGIQFRVRMTFFVFLAGRNIAFFRKAFLPSRHGAASHPRWNEIPRPICHRVTRLSFKEGKRSDRVEERKTSGIVFRTRVLKLEYHRGLRLRLGGSRKWCMSRNNTNIYRRSWSVESMILIYMIEDIFY